METRSEPRTVLFADISNSTALYARLGDVGGRQALLDALALLRRVVEAGRGMVVDQIGDELMCAFDDPADAAEAAVELQRAVSGDGQTAIRQPVSIRVGFHHGPVLHDETRLFGDSVHLARRVASAAKPQQILTTLATADAIPLANQPPMRFFDEVHVKGRNEPVKLVEIIWDTQDATLEASLDREKPFSTGVKLEVAHSGASAEVGVLSPVLTLGRGEHCDLVIDHRNVSRRHARIEYRKARFVYIDQSTNGSWVLDARGTPNFVHNDELPLVGSGTIGFGAREGDAVTATVTFRLVPVDPKESAP